MPNNNCSCKINSSKKVELEEILLPRANNKVDTAQGCCTPKAVNPNLTEQTKSPHLRTNTYIIYIIFILFSYIIVHIYADSFVNWLIYNYLGQGQDSVIPRVSAHFINNLLNIFFLLVIVVYAVAWLRAGLQVDSIRNYLVGKRRSLGYVIAVLFGAITPFCSCSSIPIFLAFSASGIPLGITMAFLITSPMVNEVAVFILWGVVGWQMTVVYVLMGLSFGILGGYIMDAIGAQKWLKLVSGSGNIAGADCACSNSNIGFQTRLNFHQRHYFATKETITIVKSVWIWLIVGIGAGSILYGYVPSSWFTEYMGAGQWWSVPVAVMAGIPLYTNVLAIIPVMDSLLQKGLPFGTTLAFSMSTVAISLPEILMLKQVMRWQLLLLFVGLMFTLFVLSGWLFDYIEILLA